MLVQQVRRTAREQRQERYAKAESPLILLLRFAFRVASLRPNLHFSVRNKSGTGTAVAQDMYDFIKSIGQINSSGIGQSRCSLERLAARACS